MGRLHFSVVCTSLFSSLFFSFSLCLPFYSLFQFILISLSSTSLFLYLVSDLSSNPMTTTVEQKIEKQNSSSNRTARNRESFGKCRFRSLKGLQFSPLSFLKHLADKVTRALHLMAMKRRPRHEQPAPAVPVASSKPLSVSAVDSHRTEAVEDCIKYINSSS